MVGQYDVIFIRHGKKLNKNPQTLLFREVVPTLSKTNQGLSAGVCMCLRLSGGEGKPPPPK